MIAYMEEIWKPIKDYEGLYEVSNLGRVKSLERVVELKEGVFRTFETKILSQSMSKLGYMKILLHKNSAIKTFLIHRLVAQAFLGDVTDLVINHKNGVKSDNRVDNLELTTHKENTKHSYETGLSKRGQEHYLSKLNEDDVRKIKYEYKDSGLSHREIGEIFNTNKYVIQKILSNKNWKHI